MNPVCRICFGRRLPIHMPSDGIFGGVSSKISSIGRRSIQRRPGSACQQYALFRESGKCCIGGYVSPLRSGRQCWSNAGISGLGIFQSVAFGHGKRKRSHKKPRIDLSSAGIYRQRITVPYPGSLWSLLPPSLVQDRLSGCPSGGSTL